MSDKSLLEEIEEKRKKLKTEGYKMSIGEISSLYKSNEININPEFQRYFRWNDIQKSRLIESIILGIPIPPIYVSQLESGVWEVIDGLQRLSTLLQFFGELKKPNGDLYDPLTLQGTKLLPSLNGCVWTAKDGQELEVPKTLKLAFKRAGIHIEIINQESDPSSKYELFQRLNTLGSSLSAQEVRNCLLIMINRPLFLWLEDLSKYPNFLQTIAISERNLEQRYESELVLRLFALLDADFTVVDWHKKIVEEFITEKSIEIATNSSFDLSLTASKFKRTFDYIQLKLDDEAFKRFDTSKNKFVGEFLVSAFEAVAISVYANIDQIESTPTFDLKQKIIQMWSNASFNTYVSRGIRATDRIKNVVPFGKTHYRP